MDFISTRSKHAVRLEQAIMSGTAPDGGLYVPDMLPAHELDRFAGVDTFASIAARFLAPFFTGASLESALPDICHEALNFPVPLHRLPDEPHAVSVLELFHGPTAAFKDVGARFLAATMVSIIEKGEYAQPPVTILVATSGDTGGAVAAAYHRKPGTRVIVLFPDGRVSPRQQHQLTCWGDNVTALAVRGEFDDCQRLVKAAFADAALNSAHNLVSANSINVGRLLPQTAYYAKSSLEHYRATGEVSNFIVPTGNLGNGFACVWARRMGMPIGRIVFATNENTTIPDFLSKGEYEPRPSKATLASAMDVGDPSNMERLRALCGDVDGIREIVSARSVSDAVIRTTIRDEYARHGIAWCPHTATGLHVYRSLPAAEQQAGHWVVVATAHAAKFDTIVEPLLDQHIEPPTELARLLDWSVDYKTIDAELDQVAQAL
ncbi:MAG: threonine synthase [Gammaproteobacteria bacterium]|jgi:threonine synthase|nr:threonine synthase [Gammaproteobacteria bacterium]MDP7152890.1 threonine synthase [Gammaproteobacteria bacterium]MDP7296052.1 threonine synthase [Gammaproteobacteria bacterium]MDP7418855.1 threonine synthase [Gammaproteobacteria bacterium]HJP38673.1 threonine synthase [Gammaproteobacteria bacterium]